jgi:hypothetical protein
MIAPKLLHLLSLYAASTLDKQRTLMNLIGEKHDWDFDMNSGTIVFNGKHTYPVQIIGTESTAAKTWLWSWANVESGIPAPLLAAANKIKAFGGQHQIAEFTAPQLKLGEVTGPLLSTIATGLTRGDAFYRGPYPGGALYLVISAPPLKAQLDSSPLRLVSNFSQLIATTPVEHRKAWKSYLEQKGYQLTEAADSVTGTSPKGEKVVARFDAHGRAFKIDSSVAS